MKVGLMSQQLRGGDMLQCHRVVCRIGDNGIAVVVVLRAGRSAVMLANGDLLNCIVSAADAKSATVS
jgi:hypothetical protein